MNKYKNSKLLYRNRNYLAREAISMTTSRGCPYRCIFCSIHLHMGKRYRVHSPKYVLNHMKILIEKYGMKAFHFEDDNISQDVRRFEEILDGIINAKWNIRWNIPNGIRADTLDFNIIKKIKRSGCNELTVAIESGCQRVLDEVIKKDTKLENILNVIRWCEAIGLRTSAFYVVGFPGEKLDEIKMTTEMAIRLLRKHQLLPRLMVATPLYGTELYNICIKKGILKHNPTFEELSTGTNINGHGLIETEDFTKEDLRSILKEYSLRLNSAKIVYALIHPVKAALYLIKNL
jgi:anaerobic magnesium-protoporphyrin IX monomethyl ester cyclase